MRHTRSYGSGLFALAMATALLAWPTASAAQAVVGDARAAQTTVLGFLGAATTTVLADSGTLDSTSDARDASLDAGSVPSVFTGEVLSASTIGWPDQVASEASLANLGLTVGGTGISADFVMARATALLGGAGDGASLVDNLLINGVPISVSGSPNQMLWIPGGQVVINEQTVSAAGTTVNALHATVFGVADVVVASASAGIQ